MYVSIRANIRTASAARSSLNGALQSALRGGAVTGLVVVALALIGIGVLFLFFVIVGVFDQSLVNGRTHGAKIRFVSMDTW